MAVVEISPPTLRVRMTGWDKLLALKSQIDVPLDHVRGVEVRPAEARRWWHGLRVGTHFPGVVTAGSYWWRDGWSFWSVYDADKAIAIYLRGEFYTRLVVQVDDPERVAQEIRTAARV